MTIHCGPFCPFLGCASCEYASGTDAPAETDVSAGQTGCASGTLEAHGNKSAPGVASTNTEGLTANSTPALPGGISG